MEAEVAVEADIRALVVVAVAMVVVTVSSSNRATSKGISNSNNSSSRARVDMAAHRRVIRVPRRRSITLRVDRVEERRWRSRLVLL